MSHLEFNEAFMGMTKGGALPGTSRKGRSRRKDSSRLTTKRRPGVDPGVLKAVRVGTKGGYKHEIRLRDGNQLVAIVTYAKGKGPNQGYTYRILGQVKPHHGFKTLGEVVARIATKL
jgi:hypothetical protein